MKNILLLMAILPFCASANEMPAECLPPSIEKVEEYIFPISNQEMDIMMETSECVRQESKSLDCIYYYRHAVSFCGQSNVELHAKSYVEQSKKIMNKSKMVKDYEKLLKSIR